MKNQKIQRHLGRQKAEIDKLYMRAAPMPSSFNEEARTMDVVFSAGTRGLRRTSFGEYYEELEISERAVRLDRFNNGAPVLTDHVARISNVIGVVESARIEDGKGIATVRFSDDEESAVLIQKIRNGIIRKISVGYMVYEYQEFGDPEEEVPVFRAVDWEPFELSFVAIPFDDAAQVRSSGEKSTCTFNFKTGEEMKKREGDKPAEQAGEKPKVEEESKAEEEKEESASSEESESKESEKPEDSEEEVQEKSEEVKPDPKDEASRSSEIMALVARAGFDGEFAKELIEANLSVEQSRKLIQTRWVREGANVKIDGRVTAGSYDEKEILARGVRDALLHRYNPSANPISEEGKAFRGLSLMRMAEKMIRSYGAKTDSMSNYEIAKTALSREFWTRAGMHGVDDFPNVLADVANKTLRQAYEQSPRTFLPFTRIVSVPDFKNINRVQLGEAPALEEVGEHGEIKHGTIGDSKETYQVKSYGKQVALTRQALINDDLDAFTRVPALFGRAAANIESDKVYEIFNSNPDMSDGNPLFDSATHGNVGTPSTINDSSLGEMRELGRLQTGIDGTTLLNIMYKFLIVPANLETVAQKQLAAIIPNAASSVNPFSGLYELIVEPRLDSGNPNNWFAAADPAQIDTIEIAYLDGAQGVRIESEIDFDTDGMKIKAMHDFGVKAIDWRGLFKNPFNGS